MLIQTVIHKLVEVMVSQKKVLVLLKHLKVVIQYLPNMKNPINVVVKEDAEERAERVEKVKENRVENHANLVVKEESHVVVVVEEEEAVLPRVVPQGQNILVHQIAYKRWGADKEVVLPILTVHL